MMGMMMMTMVMTIMITMMTISMILIMIMTMTMMMMMMTTMMLMMLTMATVIMKMTMMLILVVMMTMLELTPLQNMAPRQQAVRRVGSINAKILNADARSEDPLSLSLISLCQDDLSPAAVLMRRWRSLVSKEVLELAALTSSPLSTISGRVS